MIVNKVSLASAIKHDLEKMLVHKPHEHTNSVHLSKKFGYKYATLSSVFSEVYHCTIRDYLISRRIEKVKELIANSQDHNLTEIATKLGYFCVQHLSNQFKKRTGMSPSEFVRRIHNKKLYYLGAAKNNSPGEEADRHGPAVKESLNELEEIKLHKPDKLKPRVRMLVLMKKQKTLDHIALARALEVDSNTIRQWQNIYQKKGIDGLLTETKESKKTVKLSRTNHRNFEKHLRTPRRQFHAHNEFKVG